MKRQNSQAHVLGSMGCYHSTFARVTRWHWLWLNEAVLGSLPVGMQTKSTQTVSNQRRSGTDADCKQPRHFSKTPVYWARSVFKNGPDLAHSYRIASLDICFERCTGFTDHLLSLHDASKTSSVRKYSFRKYLDISIPL